ncbi:MAG: NAD(P)H-dependent oxidoreductase [Pseudomonadota bacterium]
MAKSPPARRILLIDAHPDPEAEHLTQVLVEAYAAGAIQSGHELRRVRLATLDFPLLRSQHAWQHHPLPAVLQPAQDGIEWAQHIVLFFPLWLGDMPALLKGFLEQVARPGFAFSPEGGNPMGRKRLTGRSARVVVTMGMPALVYRWYFKAHSVRSLERNILGFVGMSPVDETLIGSVESLGAEGVSRWCKRLRSLGEGCR